MATVVNEEFTLDGGTLDPEAVDLSADHDTPDLDAEPEPEPEPKLTAIERQLQEEREARIRLEERLAGIAAREQAPAAPKVEEPKVFTRAQLREAVNAGKIDEDQMEEVWANQQREIQRRDTEQLLEQREKRKTAESVIETERQKYIDNYPEIHDQKSETFQKVKREYDFLVRIGNPDTKATELMALRAALGSGERVRERTSDLRDTPRGVSSGGNNPNPRGDRPVDIFNQIPTKYRSYYKGRYERGEISLADIKKDLPYMDRTA